MDHGVTIVQHSGFGYAHKAGFARAVETKLLATAGERARVERAGGIVFDGPTAYVDAEHFAEKANYPDGHPEPPAPGWLAPAAAGTFSSERLDGLRVYVPVREATG